MKLLLFRHAEAAPRGGDISSDQARHLTISGRTQALQAGQLLVAHREIANVIVSSPLTRAVQTAELMTRAIGEDRLVRTTSLLEPDGSLSAFVDFLGELPMTSIVLAVGHEPHMSDWSARLLGTRTPPRPYHPGTGLIIEFTTNVEPGRGKGLMHVGLQTLVRL